MAEKTKKIVTGGKVVIGSTHIITDPSTGAATQLTVRPRCGSEAKHMCITHNERFDSAKALAQHIGDKKAAHLTGWWCPEESEEDRGPDAMGKPQMVVAPHGLESDREIEA